MLPYHTLAPTNINNDFHVLKKCPVVWQAHHLSLWCFLLNFCIFKTLGIEWWMARRPKFTLRAPDFLHFADVNLLRATLKWMLTCGPFRKNWFLDHVTSCSCLLWNQRAPTATFFYDSYLGNYLFINMALGNGAAKFLVLRAAATSRKARRKSKWICPYSQNSFKIHR
jgi:hypothetical protein